MPVTIDWQHILVRLAFTIVGGLVIGFNRGEHGRPAGMRTTLLVCLAASISMIQANLLMNSVGKTPDSFVVLDLMRLPLGILSGMGFIGAGAILRKENLVLGVTTAATLWFTTIMGLCFGGGQLGLGTCSLILGIGTLWGLKIVEQGMRQDFRGTFTIMLTKDGPNDEEIRDRILKDGCTIIAWAISYAGHGERRAVRAELQRRVLPGWTQPPAFVAEWARNENIEGVQWQPQGIPEGPAKSPPKGTPVAISGPE